MEHLKDLTEEIREELPSYEIDASISLETIYVNLLK